MVPLWWAEKLRFPFTCDNRMTLVIYAHITDSMQDAAIAALEVPLS
jgi:hypothetical protein